MIDSLDWLKGKSGAETMVFPMKLVGGSCKFNREINREINRERNKEINREMIGT